MKIIFYFAAALVTLGFAATSCDDAPKNPGDFSVKSEFSVASITSLTSGQQFDFTVVSERDTVYMYRHVKTDTLKDEYGKPVIDEKGNLITTNDTTYLPGNGRCSKGRVIELAPIIKTWTADDKGTADTLRLKVNSNARWNMLKPTLLTPTGKDYTDTNNDYRFYASCNGTEKGGGDGHIDIEMKYFFGSYFNVTQPIMTNDSAVVYLFRMQIRGMYFQ